MEQRVDRLDGAFLTGAAVAAGLVRRAEVAQQWERPSALAKMSVGALACHLGRQVVRAAERVPADTGHPTPAGDDLPTLERADDHYARAAWVTSTSPDDPANDRSTDDAEAALGPAALSDRVAGALETVRGLLTAGRAGEVVPMPWQGWSLRRDDFLLTRLLEIVVHADDLAVSIAVPTPAFPDEVFTPVHQLLQRLAVRRHGQSAVIAALTRRERARPIAAF